VTNKPADYVDVAASPVDFLPNSAKSPIGSLARDQKAAARKHTYISFNVNKLDTPFSKDATGGDAWGAVHSHNYETTGFEAVAEGDSTNRSTAQEQDHGIAAEVIEGGSGEPSLLAGGRLEITGGEPLSPRRVVLTTVQHSAYDPWMLAGSQPGTYSNQFTAIDAIKVFRPALAPLERKAPGPLLGVVKVDGGAAGEAKIDDQWRVPIEIANARDYSAKGLPKYVWLPVQQQWAHSTHGAQFFPRIGTRVIIDFLYGNPDLPFISGTVYTPSQPYPFDPTSKATQSGWRSVTDKNGSIVQEFRFEDKPGSEEVYLYTGRDYRRMIDQDDWGTVKRDQTLEVQRDQKLTVTRDRTVKIDGLQKTDITKTRTVTVTDKSTLES
jgi:type VI secretion system secreted protein VgrG